jgi:tetratricopeptide (TPR) repeat protein
MSTSSRRKAASVKKPARPSRVGARDGGQRTAANKRAGAAQPTAAPSAGTPEEHRQAETYDRAIHLLHARDCAAALPLFEAAAGGPLREMAHSALLHAQMCARRMAAGEPALRSADERYDYAITLMNTRRFAQAERHLLQAAVEAPKGDHIYYALALCCGLAGDIRAAYLHLKRAIELQPSNRMHARKDPDFARIGRLPPLAGLLYPEGAAST